MNVNALRFTRPDWVRALLLTLNLFISVRTLDAYTAHEWGTFTTLVNSRGERLSGLYLDNETLPSFVDSLPFYYPPRGKSIPDPKHLSGVTTKMETPILYFYSDSAFQAKVNIGFRGGAITQWYPQRDSGDLDPDSGGIDFLNRSSPYLGHIHWSLRVLAPTSSHSVTYPSAGGDWETVRGTNSNLLQTEDGEIEKFLFYRGLGNVELPISMSMPTEDSLVLFNHLSEDLPYILVLDLTASPDSLPPFGVWWQGRLNAGETLSLRRPPKARDSLFQALTAFERALVQAGLLPVEATSMLLKWNHNYFQTPGFKVFWILPRSLTDSILPIHISPNPDALERVLIGRSEILPPKFEAKLRQALDQGTLANYQQDRFYLAYLDYLAQSHGNGSALLKPNVPRARIQGRLRPSPLSQFGPTMMPSAHPTKRSFPWSLLGQKRAMAPGF